LLRDWAGCSTITGHGLTKGAFGYPQILPRSQKFKQEGHNAFMEYQLPHAIISLKQGAGRLIRDEHDRGVLMICDPRLVTKPYGKRIWQSLPPMKRTRDQAEALYFLKSTL
ncbi:helicase C-terminal domain-containing protein, partial [Nitrosomonas halophila]